MKTTLTPTAVMVFKTNIETEQDLNKIARILKSERNILRWNVDREDIDRVLRIESENMNRTEIQQKVEHAGFICEELAD
jgi:hypothetical protein